MRLKGVKPILLKLVDKKEEVTFLKDPVNFLQTDNIDYMFAECNEKEERKKNR